MKKFILIFVGLFLTNIAFSQTANPELVSSSGDSFNNTTYQLDWSIGECITATHSEGSYKITQGFHQSKYEITAIKKIPAEDLKISSYPNPITDFITVYFESFNMYKTFSLTLIVTNINGDALFKDEIDKKEKELNFTSFTSGIYFISIRQENKIIKTFKIIKN